MLIEVMTASGRVAFERPVRGSRQIPNDEWIKVHKTGWINRLIENGDILVRANVKAAKSAAPKATKQTEEFVEKNDKETS